MNILLLNWRDIKNPKSGGAEIVTHEHAKAWVKAGHKVTWISSSFVGGKSHDVIDGVEIIRRGSSMTTFFHAFLYYLTQGKQFDVVIDEIHGIPYFTPLYVRKPKIAFIHEVAGEIWNYMYPFPFNAIGRMIESLYFSFYKNIQFWTDAPSTIRDLTKKGIDPKKCTAIPCPVTLNISLPKVIKEESPTFIFVSRLVKMKGIEDVIKAFMVIIKEFPDARLWLIGSGEDNYVKSLKSYVKKSNLSDNVIFYGRVDEKKKYELLGRAHILLHASVKEGWGLVVLEAALQETPSVVYNVAGLRDVVIHDNTGWIVRINSPYQLGTQGIRLFKDKKRYASYQKNAQKRAQSFTWDDVTHKSLSLLHQLVKNSNI